MDCFRLAYKYGQREVIVGNADGFNVGMNNLAAAGQTVMYPHVHMIPRRNGDCADPVGGVRAVIPGQSNYRKSGYRVPA
jgi:diadenosine tetraphosphate (Ap4A) HIT family hydrolase